MDYSQNPLFLLPEKINKCYVRTSTVMWKTADLTVVQQTLPQKEGKPHKVLHPSILKESLTEGKRMVKKKKKRAQVTGVKSALTRLLSKVQSKHCEEDSQLESALQKPPHRYI